MIDDIDRLIVNILQSDARTSNAEIARRVGMAPSGVFERIRKLEERGVIAGYNARLDPKALGYGLLAFVFVRSSESCGAPDTERRLSEIPEVLEVHHVVGEDCFLVKVRVRDTDALGHLLRETLGGIGSVRSTRTTIVLHTAKETLEVPVAPPAAVAVDGPGPEGAGSAAVEGAANG